MVLDYICLVVDDVLTEYVMLNRFGSDMHQIAGFVSITIVNH